MSFSDIEALIIGSTLQMKWKLLATDVRAISIQLATDMNFTKHYNHFVIPSKSSAVTFDVGAGLWYFRFGMWSGKDHIGDISWTPTYGPASVVCAKPTLSPPLSIVTIHHAFPIPSGIHFNSNIGAKTLICVEICKGGGGFEANNTTMKYYLDWGSGGFDVRGLDANSTYALRVSRFPSSRQDEFPKSEIYHMPAGAVVSTKRPLRVPTHGDGHRMAASHGGEAMLKEAAERPSMKFPTQAAYLRFLASKTSAAYH
jgi:hypothetical protein